MKETLPINYGYGLDKACCSVYPGLSNMGYFA